MSIYNHQGTVTIETNRLLLRKFTLGDVKAMFHNWANDEDVTRYLRWNGHKAIEETEKTVSAWIQGYDKYNH